MLLLLYTTSTTILKFLLNYVAGSEAMFADLCYFSVRSVQVKSYLVEYHASFVTSFVLICDPQWC